MHSAAQQYYWGRFLSAFLWLVLSAVGLAQECGPKIAAQSLLPWETDYRNPRMQTARTLLNRSVRLNDRERLALAEAHAIGRGSVGPSGQAASQGNLNFSTLRQKARALQSEFRSRDDRALLLRGNSQANLPAVAGDLPAVAEFYSAIARGVHGFNRDNLNEDQIFLISELFLPTVGMKAIKRIPNSSDVISFRNWTFENTDQHRIVTIPFEKEKDIRLIWPTAGANEPTSQSTAGTLDFYLPSNAAQVGQIDGKSILEAWGPHIAVGLTGHSLQPFARDETAEARRVEFGEKFDDTSRALGAQAGIKAFDLEMDHFLFCAPPDSSKPAVLVDVAMHAALKSDRKIHFLITRRSGRTALLSQLIGAHEEANKIELLGPSELRLRGVGGLIQQAATSSKPLVVVTTSAGVREMLTHSMMAMIGTDDVNVVRRLLSILRVKMNFGEELTAKQVDQLVVDEVKMRRAEGLSLTLPPEVGLFETLSRFMGSFGYAEAEHLGAPGLYPFWQMFSREGVFGHGVSPMPIHRQQDLIADFFSDAVYMLHLEESLEAWPERAVINRPEDFRGALLTSQYSRAIRTAKLTGLEHVVFLEPRRVVPERASEFYMHQAPASTSQGRTQLNDDEEQPLNQSRGHYVIRDDEEIYFELFSRVAPLLVKHQQGFISVATRDEALRVYDYLNKLFKRLNWPERVFAPYFEPRTDEEEKLTAQALLDYKSGKANYLVVVNMLDKGPPFPEMSCYVDLHRNVDPKLFAERLRHLLTLTKGKEQIDVLALIELNELNWSAYLDIVIAVKNGEFSHPSVQSRPVDLPDMANIPPEFLEIFSNEDSYLHYLRDLEHQFRQRFLRAPNVDGDSLSAIARSLEADLTRLFGNYGANKPTESYVGKPGVERLTKSLEIWGELLYLALNQKCRNFIDRHGFLLDVAERYNRNGVLDENSLQSATSRYDYNVSHYDGPQGEIDPYREMGSEELRDVSEAAALYLSSEGRLPPAISIIGRRLRRALNTREKFLEIADPTLVLRIEEEGVISLAANMNDVIRNFATSLKPREALFMEYGLTDEEATAIKQIRGSQQAVKRLIRTLKAYGISKTVRNRLLMESVRPTEEELVADLIDAYVRDHKRMPPSHDSAALMGRLRSCDQDALLASLQSHRAEVLVRAFLKREKRMDEELQEERKIMVALIKTMRTGKFVQSDAWFKFVHLPEYRRERAINFHLSDFDQREDRDRILDALVYEGSWKRLFGQ